MYIYMFVRMYVCVCVCVCTCAYVHVQLYYASLSSRDKFMNSRNVTESNVPHTSSLPDYYSTRQ